MTLPEIKHALRRTYADVVENHTMQMAAALSYYFVLSLFPALIFLSAIVAYLPLPDLFNQTLALMARFLPADTMGLVRRVLADVVSPNKGTFLSFGILGTLWAASGGFSAAIEALNVAYDVQDDRPFWKTRPLAVGLSLAIRRCRFQPCDVDRLSRVALGVVKFRTSGDLTNSRAVLPN